MAFDYRGKRPRDYHNNNYSHHHNAGGHEDYDRSYGGGAPCPPPYEYRPNTAYVKQEECAVNIGVQHFGTTLNEEKVFDYLKPNFHGHVQLLEVYQIPELPEWQWVRAYFLTTTKVEEVVTHYNMPGHPTKFTFNRNRYSVIVVAAKTSQDGEGKVHTGIDSMNPQFESMVSVPEDTVVVDTQEGFVNFSTSELYRTKGADDYMQAKRESGKVIRRLVCKHFDPAKGTLCKFGNACSFVHVKERCINRLLRVTTPYQEMRLPRFEDDIQLSTWEFERRHDALVLRYLGDTTKEEVSYMFQECEGYVGCIFRKHGLTASAVVLFRTTENATRALLQTMNSGLNIGFYGVMEDLRTMLLQEAKARNDVAAPKPLERLPGDPEAAPVQPPNATVSNATSKDTSTGGGLSADAGRNPRKDRYEDRRRSSRQRSRSRDRHPSRGRRGEDRKYNNDRRDNNNNKYINEKDDRRRDTKPSGGSNNSSSNVQQQQQNSSKTNTKEQSNIKKDAQNVPFPPLPEGYSYSVSQRSGNYYFYENGSKKTEWNHPITKLTYSIHAATGRAPQKEENNNAQATGENNNTSSEGGVTTGTTETQVTNA
eukprot:PhF_6_TR6945/c1_g1_i1/m.10195